LDLRFIEANEMTCPLFSSDKFFFMLCRHSTNKVCFECVKKHHLI
jgi:hypothetical protein